MDKHEPQVIANHVDIDIIEISQPIPQWQNNVLFIIYFA